MYKLEIHVDNFQFHPDYFTKLLGCVHKWIGDNDLHDNTSLYNYSHIRHDLFSFVAFDNEILNKVVIGISKDAHMFDDCCVSKIVERKRLWDKDEFYCLSPFFVKQADKHLLFNSASKRAKDILNYKARLAGVELGEFDLKFINNRKTKLIKIHNINNRCFVSNVKITGGDEVKKFATKVGIGSSTGCGFGYIN